MSTTQKPMIDPQTREAVTRNLELVQGYIAAQLEDADNMEQVSEGAHTILLPEDDPECFEHNLQSVISSLRSGANVCARHVTKDGRPK
ncbi:MAG: hypothetical protein QOF01_110 [Thermomicrobiales bacterium]|nr:hypothetical protein [Thermomicrobiales bacterium]